MNAPTKFASRFTDPLDPIALLRMLHPEMDGDDAAYEARAEHRRAAKRSTAAAESARGKPAGAEQPAADPKPGHDGRGRFTHGNPGGPGNPYNRQVAALRKQLLDAMTPAVFQQAAEALVIQACSGNVAALKLLFQYTLGKPLEAVHPDRVALDEVDLLRESNNSGREWRDLIGAPVLEILMELLRALQVVSTELFQKRFWDGIAGLDAADAEAARKKEARRARRQARNQQAVARGQEAGVRDQESEVGGSPSSHGEVTEDCRAADPCPDQARPADANAGQASDGGPMANRATASRATANGVNGAGGATREAGVAPTSRDAAAMVVEPDADAAPPPAGEQSASPAGVADREKTKAPPLTNGDGEPPGSVCKEPHAEAQRTLSKLPPRTLRLCVRSTDPLPDIS